MGDPTPGDLCPFNFGTGHLLCIAHRSACLLAEHLLFIDLQAPAKIKQVARPK